MSEFSLQIEKITGLADEKSACSVSTKRITLADGIIGTFVSCVLIKDGDNPGVILNDIFEICAKKLEAADSDLLVAVKSAKDACCQYVADRQIELSFVHILFYQEAVYIAKQSDKVKLFVYEGLKSLEITFSDGSGPLKGDQIYLIATSALLSILDTSVFSKDEDVDLREVIDGLATEISSKKNQGDLGAVFILVKSKEMEGTKETEGTEETKLHELQKVREVSEVSPGKRRETEVEASLRPVDSSLNQEISIEKAGSKFENPLPSFFRAVFQEIKKLIRGDLGATGRLRKRMAVVAVVILLILGASAFFTIRQKGLREKQNRFDEHLVQASAKYSEAVAILELNKARAREILTGAQEEIKLAQEIISSNERANKLSTDISQKLAETDIQSTINFHVLSEHSQPVNSLSFRSKKLVGIASDKLFEIDPDNKSTSETEGPTSTNSGFIYDNKGFVLAGGKVYRVDLTNDKSETIIENGAGHDIVIFIGNVYLLGNNQIVKFSPIEGGYAQGIDYLNEKLDLGSDSRFAIDGNVWATGGDKIFKFLRGERQAFEISGLTGSVGELTAIYTSANLDNLYVIDKKNSALLVIDKDGFYKKAYQSPEFGKAGDLVVNDDKSKVYLAVGDRILEAGL